jgi:hypothetical protein
MREREGGQGLAVALSVIDLRGIRGEELVMMVQLCVCAGACVCVSAPLTVLCNLSCCIHTIAVCDSAPGGKGGKSRVSIHFHS